MFLLNWVLSNLDTIVERAVDFAVKKYGLFKIRSRPFETGEVFLSRPEIPSFMDSRLAGTTQKFLTLKICDRFTAIPDPVVGRVWSANTTIFQNTCFGNNQESQSSRQTPRHPAPQTHLRRTANPRRRETRGGSIGMKFTEAQLETAIIDSTRQRRLSPRA